MNATTLQVKNMVCPRCVQSVREALQQLDIGYQAVDLGTVTLLEPLTPQEHGELTEELVTRGFELLEDRDSQLVNQIKSLLVAWVHHQDDSDPFKLSERLAQALHRDYSTLSKTFSQHQGTTIEQYWMQQRVERAKELLSYGDLSVGEIAFDLGYSSTAHFSNQFKKHTGCPPSTYQKRRQKDRRFLDAIE